MINANSDNNLKIKHMRSGSPNDWHLADQTLVKPSFYKQMINQYHSGQSMYTFPANITRLK